MFVVGQQYACEYVFARYSGRGIKWHYSQIQRLQQWIFLMNFLFEFEKVGFGVFKWCFAIPRNSYGIYRKKYGETFAWQHNSLNYSRAPINDRTFCWIIIIQFLLKNKANQSVDLNFSDVLNQEFLIAFTVEGTVSNSVSVLPTITESDPPEPKLYRLSTAL